MDNFFTELKACGPLLWIIIALLGGALLIVVERWFYLHRARIDTTEVLRGLMNQLRNGKDKEAIANCDNSTGPTGQIFRTAIEHWQDGESGIRHAVEEAYQLVLPQMERYMKLLAGLGNITPLLGLLGTIITFIDMFSRIKPGNVTSIDSLASDISRALIFTAAGLIVSMICQLFHTVLTEKLDRQLAEMAKGAAEMTYFLTSNPKPKNED